MDEHVDADVDDEVERPGDSPPDWGPDVEAEDGEQDIDIGVIAEVAPELRLDVDGGEDAAATAGGLDDDLDDLRADPGVVVDLRDDAGESAGQEVRA